MKTETKETAVQDGPPEATVTPATEKPEPKPNPAPERRSAPIATATSAPSPTEWRNFRTGEEIRTLAPSEKYADIYPPNGLSLGRAIRALVVGDWTGAEQEQRALSTSANPSAGILVPNPLASRVIDLARNKSILMASGAQTVDMAATTLTIARVATDATVEVKGENASFTGSDATFDAVELTAYTLGIVLKMSRELAADAPNSVSLIENMLSAKLAEKLDFFGLQGTGSAQPLGIVNFSGTNSVAVGGSVDYDDIINGVGACETDNVSPNAYLMAPANATVLRLLKLGDGQYVAPPAAISQLTPFVSANMPSATMVVADMTKVLVGMRQGITIEVSNDAGTAFADHQTWIKATVRVAFNVENSEALCLLTGIA